MTDLSKQLRSVFNKIKTETDLTSDGFKKIVRDAKTNSNIAEKYLIAQKTSNLLSEKINEFKSKSGYLDSIGLKFKQQELVLQKQITNDQISRLLQSNALDAVAKKEAIDALKLKIILSDTELKYLDQNNAGQNSIVTSLNNQLVISDDILDNIQLINDGVIDTNSVTGALKGSFNFLFGKTGLIVKDLGKLGEYLQYGVKPATLLVDIIKIGYENFKAFDKAAVSVRSNLGALPGQAKQLESLIKQVGIESMHLGVTFDDVAKSINEIANEFTGLVAQDTDLLKITTALSKQFGIAEGTSVKFLKTLGGISGNSASSQRSMIGFAQKMAQASGVPLGKIMQDVAEASDDVRIYVGSSAVSMIKTATAARMLGIDMNKAAATAEKLLQFESSIASELKASALLGQNVNFNYARRLFFNKNIIDGNKEILRITKQVNFNQLDPIKQKAYADAAGKSVGELQDMLQQEKNIQLVKNGTNEKAKKALVDYERMMQLKDKEAKNEGKLAEKQILQMANQEKLVQIQNKFNQLMSELAKPVMDIVEPLLDLAIIVLPLILRSAVPIAGLFEGISRIFVKMKPSVLSLVAGIEAMALTGNKFFGGLSTGISYFLTAIEKIKSIFGTVSGFFSKLPLIGSYFSKFGGFLGTFGKFLGPIGLVINAFTFISSLMKRWEESPKGFIGGLEAIGGALYDTFLKPFKDAYDWISSIFVGKSPSELGLGIVKGIKSVGGMLLDAITLPFRTGYNFISGLFGGVKMNVPSEVLFGATDDTKKVGTGVKSINNDGLIKTVQDENDVTFTNNDSLIKTVHSGNQQLVAKLDQLIAMMANGGIAVNLDGQKIDKFVATSKIKSGGFGQATMA